MPRVQVVQRAQGVPRWAARGVPVKTSKYDDPVRYKLNRAYGDEFEHTSFAALQRRWQMRNAVAADFDFPGGSAVLWHPSGSGSFLYQAVPAGDWQALLEYSSMGVAGQGMCPSIALFDDFGNGGAASIYSDGNAYAWSLSSWSYNTTLSNAGSYRADDGRRQLVVLRKSGTTLLAKFSANLGSNWSGEATGITTVAATHRWLGIGRIFTTDPGWIMLHRFNVFATQVV